MLALARTSDAPRMDRAQAARALGADLAQLDRALAGGAHDTQDDAQGRVRGRGCAWIRPPPRCRC